MEKSNRYRIYSEYLKDKYGSKAYKIPINLPLTCPNRDNTCGKGGCIFCGEVGTGYESLPSNMGVREQLDKNIGYIGPKYKAEKFIAYFQNYSNTYMDIGLFKKYTEEACIKDVVGLSISTRPDCIGDEYLEHLCYLRERYGVDILIELGLQTVNYHTLKIINRGHGLAEFIDAALRCKARSIEVCCHFIPDLPWDNIEDIIEGSKIISALGIDQVKLHSLYIVKNTALEKMYSQGKVELITKEEYIDRVIAFLEHLNPHIVIQRLIGRAPEQDTVIANWNTSWWKVKEQIEKELELRNSYQGARFDYLNGKALRKFR